MSICLMLVSSTPHFSELSTNIFQVDEIAKPTIYDTLLFRIPKFAYAKSVGRLLGKKPSEDALEVEEDESADENSALKNATAANSNGEARKRKPKIRAR